VVIIAAVSNVVVLPDPPTVKFTFLLLSLHPLNLIPFIRIDTSIRSKVMAPAHELLLAVFLKALAGERTNIYLS